MRTSSLLFYRYFLFGLLIVCNAIICSAAVWSLSNARIEGITTPVDAFMIFLGAFSLILVLPILFFDVFVRHAWTGWVSTELVWVTLLWALHLAGATAITAIPEPLMCSTIAKRTVPHSCLSVRLMMVPAWICTLGLSVYLVAFVTAIVVHRRRNDTLWYASVRAYPWYEHRRCQQINSAPASPRAIVAPRPARPVRIPAPSEMQYEYLGDLPQPPAPAAPAPQETRQVALDVSSLYPLHMRPFVESGAGPSVPTSMQPPPASIQPPLIQPPIMVVTPLWRAVPGPPGPADQQGPSPLGDWPRADIMKQPSPKARAARRKPPPPASSTTEPVPEPHARRPSVSLTTTAERPSHPTGPRHRSRSSADMPRPPPLDMSRISNMQTRRQFQSGS